MSEHRHAAWLQRVGLRRVIKNDFDVAVECVEQTIQSWKFLDFRRHRELDRFVMSVHQDQQVVADDAGTLLINLTAVSQ